MPKMKQSTIKTVRKNKIVTGSGMKKKHTLFMASRSLQATVLIVFAMSFSFVGHKLLRSSSAETYAPVPGDVTIVTWNAMKDNRKNDGKEVKSILATADVIGLQEVHTAKQRSRINSLTKTKAYAGYPSKLPNNNSAGAASYPIIWRETAFDLVSSGKTGQVSAALGDLRPRYITWVRLRAKSTGKEFYVANTHMIKYVDSFGATSVDHLKNVGRYTGHMAALTSLLQKLQASAIPLFVTGDFAVDYRTDNKGTTIFPKTALNNIGLKSNWELTNLATVAPTAKTYGTSSNYPPRLIDYVFASVEVMNPVTTIAPSSHGSDHYPVYLKATLP